MHLTSRYIALAAAALPFAISPVAASSADGVVQWLTLERGGAAFFLMSGTHNGAWPACATLARYAINTNTMAGQAVYSAIMSAKVAGLPVIVYGTGDCADWPDSEAVEYISVP